LELHLGSLGIEEIMHELVDIDRFTWDSITDDLHDALKSLGLIGA
jgi:hypothetical protein